MRGQESELVGGGSAADASPPTARLNSSRPSFSCTLRAPGAAVNQGNNNGSSLGGESSLDWAQEMEGCDTNVVLVHPSWSPGTKWEVGTWRLEGLGAQPRDGTQPDFAAFRGIRS